MERKPSIWQALLPVVFLILLLVASVNFFGSDASYGPNQIALILCRCGGFTGWAAPRVHLEADAGGHGQGRVLGYGSDLHLVGGRLFDWHLDNGGDCSDHDVLWSADTEPNYFLQLPVVSFARS